jgi:hypothetical protein
MNHPATKSLGGHCRTLAQPNAACFARKLCCDVELVRRLGGPIRGVVDWRQR